MTANDIRTTFFSYFNGKNHKIVTSAPIVVKNDPTLMFTNAGMNQFKDIFLGNTKPEFKRVANSQKCLRVSGKHNDLEEVGRDTYHHTMFEMLGNWSFGDYFKEEAINWGWDFLTNELNIDKDRLYVTIFEGDASDNLEKDHEAYEFWKRNIDETKIINGSKKDNFWEMGETGPCGPCSEIHVDLRDDKERKKIDGLELVNKDHPLVVEIWNLVFIQFNRKANGILEKLPQCHVDTGMGFERLAMVVQHKTSNYDTDIFQPIIKAIGQKSGKSYGDDKKTDIAMRVVADHLRAVSFSIADGQIPSNNKAGYVIRRILRRAIRYAYSFLGIDEPFVFELLPVLIEVMGPTFKELSEQKEFISKVIKEEEIAFLRTLENGIKLLDQHIEKLNVSNKKLLSGKSVFELYDTYGFPSDLTELILREKGLTLDHAEFQKELDAQKNRSKKDAKVNTDDWVELIPDEAEEFVGYSLLQTDVKITRYRKVNTKGKDFYHLVFNNTPFYAESGGQVGDSGVIENENEKIQIINTIKENNLNIHIAKQLPEKVEAVFKAKVDMRKRSNTASNHTATHLLHYALRKVLGNHVEQRGSLVHPDYLRFDFSHYQKMTDEEIEQVEKIVNQLIRENNMLDEYQSIPIAKAQEMGAMALFGEKYGDTVRVIRFGDSVELCGGTHVSATGQIGYFKIIKEGAIAAGIRRIEAISSEKSEKFIADKLHELKTIESLFNAPNVVKEVERLMEENQKLQQQLNEFSKSKLADIKKSLISEKEDIKGVTCIIKKLSDITAPEIKDLVFQLKNQLDKTVIVIGAEVNNKANLTIMISESIVKEGLLQASDMIREISKEIQGGGGGQDFFATAGGKNIAGIDAALKKAREIIAAKL